MVAVGGGSRYSATATAEHPLHQIGGRFDRTFGELSRAAHRPGPELAEGRPHDQVGTDGLLPAFPQLVSYVFGGAEQVAGLSKTTKIDESDQDAAKDGKV
jgi:hypothetical protein